MINQLPFEVVMEGEAERREEGMTLKKRGKLARQPSHCEREISFGAMLAAASFQMFFSVHFNGFNTSACSCRSHDSHMSVSPVVFLWALHQMDT